MIAHRFMAWVERRRAEEGLSRDALCDMIAPWPKDAPGATGQLAPDRLRYLERGAPSSLRVTEANALAVALWPIEETPAGLELARVLAMLASEETP